MRDWPEWNIAIYLIIKKSLQILSLLNGGNSLFCFFNFLLSMNFWIKMLLNKAPFCLLSNEREIKKLFLMFSRKRRSEKANSFLMTFFQSGIRVNEHREGLWSNLDYLINLLNVFCRSTHFQLLTVSVCHFWQLDSTLAFAFELAEEEDLYKSLLGKWYSS